MQRARKIPVQPPRYGVRRRGAQGICNTEAGRGVVVVRGNELGDMWTDSSGVGCWMAESKRQRRPRRCKGGRRKVEMRCRAMIARNRTLLDLQMTADCRGSGTARHDGRWDPRIRGGDATDGLRRQRGTSRLGASRRRTARRERRKAPSPHTVGQASGSNVTLGSTASRHCLACKKNFGAAGVAF